MPVHNCEKYIKETISSALNQTYSNFELIIIDDGSTDNTANIIKNFNDPRIKYFYQKNSGVSRARNHGIYISQGKLLAFLDADDIWYPHKLESQIKEIRKSPEIGLVYSWVQYIDVNNNLIGETKYNIDKNFYINLLLGNYIDNGSVPLIKRECFDKVGKFNNIRTGEDWDMWIRIAREYDFGFVKDYLIQYRIHPEGSSKNYKDMETRLFEILEREFNLINLKNPITKKIKKKAYSYRYIYLSGVCHNLMQHKDAFSYTLKAIQAYPPVLKERVMLKEIIKLFIIILFPKSSHKHIMSLFKSFWNNKSKHV